MHPVVTWTAGVLVSGLVAVMSSSPAHATGTTVSVTCGASIAFSPATVTAGMGDTVTLTTDSSAYSVTLTGDVSGAGFITLNSSEVYTMTGNAGGTLTLTAAGGPCIRPGQTFTINGVGSSGSTAADMPPASILQQFAAIPSVACDTVAPPSLNWAGVSAGGWATSWAAWRNGGSGGAVCTRTLAYRTAIGGWTVVTT